MQELAIPAEASGKATAKGKQRRVPAKVKYAVDLLFSGECKTQKAAAERAGLTREYLNRALAQDHVNDYFTHKAKLEMRAALPIAIAVKAGLLHAVSEKVQSEVASEIMGIGGISAPKTGHQTNVNVSVAAGYVINLATKAEQQPTIDITPERAVSGGVSETTG
jgi:hypothetical protein